MVSFDLNCLNQEATTMALIASTCRVCGEVFEYDPATFAAIGLAGEVPARCPTCRDKRQGRPRHAVVVPGGRKLLNQFPAVAVHLPTGKFAEWKTSVHGDKPCLRATIKGDDLSPGHQWDGRLDVYCLSPTVPAVARVRVMEVTHEKGSRRIEKIKDASNAVPGVSLSHPGQPKIEVEREYPATYQYLVLEPTDAEPTAALILLSVHHKTTLKGFGRQFVARLNAAGALWCCELSSSARETGRFGIYGAIAVVDDNHCVETEQWGDVRSHTRFSLSHPRGEDISVKADGSAAA